MSEAGVPIEIATEEHDDRVVVGVSGEVDVQTCGLLEHAVRDVLSNGADTVVVDLAAVEFLDSSGLRSLVTLQREANDRGAELLLGGTSRPVRRVLELTGLTSLFRTSEG